jgi:hypothetical protein
MQKGANALRLMLPWQPAKADKLAEAAIPQEEVTDVEQLDSTLLLHALHHLVRHEPSALQGVNLVTLH